MTASDPCFLSVAEAAALIAAKRLSPVELVQAYLARIVRLDSTLHAYVRMLHDEALTAARAAEAEIAAGRHLFDDPISRLSMRAHARERQVSARGPKIPTPPAEQAG